MDNPQQRDMAAAMAFRRFMMDLGFQVNAARQVYCCLGSATVSAPLCSD
jgi:hypothetical protein